NRRVLAALGLAGCSIAACDSYPGAVRRGEGPRSVEPRLTSAPAYARCSIDQGARDLIPDARCGGRTPRNRKYPSPPAGEGDALRGGTVGGGMGSSARDVDLGDLLAAGDAGDLGRALRRLEAAVAADPHDARSWSDLAASHLVRAQRMDDPRDLLRAYEAADRAVREDGSLEEARFNRAL